MSNQEKTAGATETPAANRKDYQRSNSTIDTVTPPTNNQPRHDLEESPFIMPDPPSEHDERLKSEEQLLNLLLNSRACFDKWKTSGVPVESFHEYNQPIIEAITWAYSENVRLTRQSFKRWMETTKKVKIPSEIVGQLGVYNRVHISLTKPDDLPMLLEKVKTQFIRHKSLEHLKQYNRDRNQVGDLEANRRLAERNQALDCLVDDEIQDEAHPFADRLTANAKRESFSAAFTSIMDYLSTKTAEPAALRHFFCAALAVGNIIGKRAIWENRGSTYFLNLSAAILGDSGSNKSGFCRSMLTLMQGLGDIDNPSSSTFEAFADYHGTVIERDAKELKEQRSARVEFIIDHDRQNPKGVFLLIDEFRAFIKSMVPDHDSEQKASQFCRLFENDDLVIRTKTKGYAIMGNMCLSFLGFTPSDPWNCDMRSAKFQQWGLGARIIPVNPKTFDISGYESQSGDLDKARTELQRIHDYLSMTTRVRVPIEIVFGTDREIDLVGQEKEHFRQQTAVAWVLKNNPDQYQLIESKIVVQAAKLAGILAIADKASTFQKEDDPFASDAQPQEDGEESPKPITIDAKRFLRGAMTIVGMSHLANMYHGAVTTEQREMMQQIVSVVQKRKGATRREIIQFANLRPYDVDQYLGALVSDGILLKRPSPSGRTGVYHRTKKPF